MTRFTVTGDAGGAVKAVNDLVKAIAKGEEAFDKTTKKATALDKAAQQITKNNEGPQEKYNRRIKELADLVNKGKLSFEQADIAARRYAKQLDEAGKAGKAAFGPAMLGNIASMATGFLSVTTAINATVNAFRTLQAERDRVAQGQLGAIGGLGALSQLAATEATPQLQNAKMLSLLAEARRIYASGGASSINEAADQVAFAANSAGLGDADREFAVLLRSSGVMQDVGGASTAFTALRTAMGAGEVGSFRDFISKSLAASSVAPAQANEIAQAAAKSGSSLRTLGLSDEFGLAATAILSKVAGTAPEGGTLLSAFLQSAEKSKIDFGGGSGVDLVRRIASMPESQQGLGGVLGDREEAVKGFRILRDNIDELAGLMGTVGAAPGKDLAGRAVELTDIDPIMRAAKKRRNAQARFDVALGNSVALDNLIEATISESAAGAAMDGVSFLETINMAIARGRGQLFKMLGGDAGKMSFINEIVSGGNVRDEELLRNISEMNRAIRSNVTTRQE